MLSWVGLSSIMLVYWCCAVFDNLAIARSITKDLHKRNSTFMICHHKTSLLDIEENVSNNTATIGAKNRFKRQQSSGAGKFTEAAQVPQLKLLRLFLTMFKNLWAASHTGGSHPFHPYVPKPIVQLFKYRIVDFFFPDIGVETVKINK